VKIERARALIETQLQFTSGYNRNAVRMILAEVQLVHGQAAVDRLIREYALEKRFDLRPGEDYSSLRRT
jgi:hypothetical protein